MNLKILSALLLIAAPALAQLDPKAEAQTKIDQFLNDHEVYETHVYCRDFIATPECRTIMFYREKTSKTPVRSFQISFSAPFRQAGGTEYFLKTADENNIYNRFMDSTINQKLDIDDVGQDLNIVTNKDQVMIENIKFGTTLANLSFDKKQSLLKGYKIDPNTPDIKTPVEISYGYLGSRDNKSFSPEIKK